MAFGFLGNLLSTKRTPQENQAQSLLDQASDYTNLSMNPNDPRYQAMLSTQTQNLRQQYTRNLRDIIEANRRQALMGRQQIFDPERRDESAFSALNQAGQQAQVQANQNVIDSLNNAIARLQGQAAGYTGLAGLQNQRNEQRRQAILGLLGTGVQAGKLFI